MPEGPEKLSPQINGETVDGPELEDDEEVVVVFVVSVLPGSLHSQSVQ